VRQASSTDKIQSYTTREVGDALGFSARHIRSLVEAGELAAFDAGQGSKRPVYRITASALATFVRRRKKRVPSPEPAEVEAAS
jgi:hypothetical protein